MADEDPVACNSDDEKHTRKAETAAERKTAREKARKQKQPINFRDYRQRPYNPGWSREPGMLQTSSGCGHLRRRRSGNSQLTGGVGRVSAVGLLATGRGNVHTLENRSYSAKSPNSVPQRLHWGTAVSRMQCMRMQITVYMVVWIVFWVFVLVVVIVSVGHWSWALVHLV